MKKMELKRCEFLKNKSELGLTLSEKDRKLRNLENDIWKIILKKYFINNNNEKIIEISQYEEWAKEFAKICQKIKNYGKLNNNLQENLTIICDIVKTLPNDIARDKLFLEKEKITIKKETKEISTSYNFVEINLDLQKMNAVTSEDNNANILKLQKNNL